VRPIAHRRPPSGRRYGSAFGSLTLSRMCATTKRETKNSAYVSEPAETTSCRAM
jgi:hypothetical protein